MRQRLCNYCGQPLPEIRLGVRLTPMKARIVDFVMRTGNDGINVEDLMAFLEINRSCLKSHIAQINEAIARGHYRIYTRGKISFLIKTPPPRNGRKGKKWLSMR